MWLKIVSRRGEIKARLDAPGALHNIIIRGIERRKISRDNKDRDNFIDRLSDLLPATQTACYAWAFITNQKNSKKIVSSLLLTRREKRENRVWL